MLLTRKIDFDPEEDLRRIADLTWRWKSMFRPSDTTSLPYQFLPEIDGLDQAVRLRLYLVTRPQEPIALAILDGLDPGEALELLALTPLDDDQESTERLIRPFTASREERKQMMSGAPPQGSGRGVFPFLLGEPEGLALLDLEPEGLVLALIRWGGLNVLDSGPLFAQRMAMLSRRVSELGLEEEDQ